MRQAACVLAAGADTTASGIYPGFCECTAPSIGSQDQAQTPTHPDRLLGELHPARRGATQPGKKKCLPGSAAKCASVPKKVLGVLKIILVLWLHFSGCSRGVF